MPYSTANAVLVATGTLTAAAGIGLLAPRQAFSLLFGMRTEDRTTILVVRHWCLLIALVGGLLIYAGNHAQVRVPVVIAATLEKLVLAALVVASRLRKRLRTVAIVSADVIMAALYVTFLSTHPLDATAAIFENEGRLSSRGIREFFSRS